MKKIFSMLLCGAMFVSFNACNTNDPDESGNGSNNNGGNTLPTGQKAVDLGLPSGTLWATCNVGATKPEEYGDYFAWGETLPKENYDSSNEGDYKWGIGNEEASPNYGMTKYNTIDSKTVLEASDDAATANWGGDWRTPTTAEQQELLSECTWTWTDDYNGTGVSGCIVTGKNNNSIFLPAAGARIRLKLKDSETYGYYWSSSLEDDLVYSAWNIGFASFGQGIGGTSRHAGYSVRPVCSPR